MTDQNFLYIDPGLIEAAVLAALRDHPQAQRFHGERARLYEMDGAEARERGFAALHSAWFQRLGLGAAIEQALGEQPGLRGGLARSVVLRAVTKKDEGAELFVASSAARATGQEKTLRLLVRAESLLNQSQLLEFLRHELFHVMDMIDAAFGYEPALPKLEGGPTHDALLRERYRALWDTTINGRMARRGWLADSSRARHLAEFAAAFPMLGEHTEALFERFFAGAPLTHAQLVAFAQEPRAPADVETKLPQPGSRCSLCGFPTHAFEPSPERLPEELIAAIRNDFPRWQGSDGLCIQCADLYRANQLSRAAARLLPGWPG